MRATINLQRGDCMDAMRGMNDNSFELAIVDPPYGIGVDGNKEQLWPDGSIKRKAHEIKGWDSIIPTKEYFDELKRVSVNQIIWGGNYFTEHLAPTKAWIFWYKEQTGLTMSDGELAWTSFEKVTRMFSMHRTHVWQEKPIHPTQKAVKLYKWLLNNYAKEGDKILDTHGGSMSIAIACWDMGFDLDLWELDKDYFEAGKARFKNHQAQGQLF